MRASAWLLGLAACLAVLFVAGAAGAATDDVAETEKEVGFFISGIIEILLKPLKNLLLTQINSIINSIKDQGGIILGNVKQLIDGLLEIIRPFIIRILDQINNIIGSGVELKERLRMAVEALFKYIGIIGDANKEIVKKLIMYIVEKLLPTAAELDVHRQFVESPFLLAKIKEHLIAPIIEFARRQIESIIRSILDQASIIGGQLLEHAGVIAELIRPHVIRILDIAGNLHGEAIHLREAVRAAVTSIIGNLGSIGAESVEIMSRLIDLVTDILVSKISGKTALVAQDEAFLIIDRVIGWIVQPILNKINSLLDQIRRLIEDKTDEAKAKLQRLIDELTLLLKDPVVRIVGILGDIGIEIGDLAKAIKRALEAVIDNVAGIHETNKAIFKSILTHIITGLLKLMGKEEAAVVARSPFEFSIIAVIINRILGPIVDMIDNTLTKLREAIEAKVGEAAELLHHAVETLAKLLAPHIARIVEIFIQMGIGSRDLVENVRRIMGLILSSLNGIAEANKEILGRMLNDLMRRIVDIVRADWPLRQ